ncbi:MAG: 1-(5-phosphoribosyl)-5-[(5-phosphoribosylamino)methylideneamino]imidazole-4-carboxamide isomerase [Fusobacteriia bacterium 4572_132]|nr:MAG: 1-(5-phosphoribosyl)-5-[(5-phosphoribosylamino)methylideneamino]imidazole-4-carboxamide isomerase [Fusobacteriia bacterium 4572_132]
MIIFPAIDIKNGKCVRLEQGDFNKEKVFSENPADVAKNFEKLGAKYIHLVDLDGALDGKLKNKEVISEIRKVVKIPLELGGGIRSIERIEELINLGINRVILGTAAVKNPKLVEEAIKRFGSDKIVIGIDAKKDMVAIKGWVEISKIKTLDLVNKMEKIGVKTIIYTDIAKDGMLEGVNIEEIIKITESSSINVVASGGVSSIEDIKELKELNNPQIEGVITGKAIYEKRLDLKEAIEEAEDRK